MKQLSRRLAAQVLSRVLARPCGIRIPRSGTKGAAVNCFNVSIDKGGEPYLLIQSLEKEILNCLEWDGSRFATPTKHSLTSFRLRDFSITHYYGLAEIRSAGILDFAKDWLTKWPYIKIHAARTLTHVDQYIFNKKKLVAKERKGLLKVLVNEALEGRAEHETLDLMTALYSIKWFSHPQGEQAQARLEFYLKSLAETGELRKIGCKYIVTGKALQAIEEYEEQERKHTESVKMQWRTFWLAVAVAFLTVVQAGLIKLPPLLDFSAPVSEKP